MKSYLAACLVLICLGSPACTKKTDLENDLQQVLDTFLAENPVAPGVSVYAVCPDLDLDWRGTAGTAAKDDTDPLTSAHTFRIASNTKTYVAAAVLRLIEDGLIGLNDPLSKYITPDLNALLKSDGYDTDTITIEQVLSHTAGFGDHTRDERFEEMLLAEPHRTWKPMEKLGYLVEWCEPVGKPGEKYEYSDSGYIILGGVIESLTGKKIGPAVRELVDFESLDLNVTYWEIMEEAPAAAGPRAHQYYGEIDVTDWNFSFDLYGGGGIVTDAYELAMFMRKLLAGEVLAKDSTLAMMLIGGTEPYRLGLMYVRCGELEAFGHQGFWNTFAYHVPELDLTVSGSILNHHATNGYGLMCRMVETVAAAKAGSTE